MRTQKYLSKKIFKKILNFFSHKKLKKPPQKVAYLWQYEAFFFFAAPPAPNSPEVHLRFKNPPTHSNSSVPKSVIRSHLSILFLVLGIYNFRNRWNSGTNASPKCTNKLIQHIFVLHRNHFLVHFTILDSFLTKFFSIPVQCTTINS